MELKKIKKNLNLMNRLLTTEEKLQIIDEIETIFVSSKGMPQSANDDIMKKLRALKVDQQERSITEKN